jgi:hypothetical protein
VKPAGIALLVGGLRGAVAFGSIVLVAGGLLYFSDGTPRPRELLRGVLGGALAGAFLCGVEAASMRFERRGARWVIRFVAGAIAPLVSVVPQLGMFDLKAMRGFHWSSWSSDAETFAVFSVCLGASLLLAGEPKNAPHQPHGCGRVLLVSTLTVTLPLLWSIGASGDPMNSLVFLCLVLPLLGGVVAAVVWLAESIAAPVVEPLALRIEPDMDLDELGPGAIAKRGLMAAESSLWRAARARVADRRERLYREALEAVELVREAPPGVLRPAMRARLVVLRAEALLGLRRLDEAEVEAKGAPCEPAVRAEAARLRGDAARAVQISEEWLASGEGSKGPVRASAFALLALARFDQGQLDEARRFLAAARGESAWHARALHHLTPDEVRAYIEPCRPTS